MTIEKAGAVARIPIVIRHSSINMPSTLHYLSLDIEDVPDADEWFSAGELSRLAGFRIAKRRSEWRLGRWTAKRAASLYLGMDLNVTALSRLEIRAARDGAPEVFMEGQQAPLSLSISHSAGRSLCVVGDRSNAVGCDLEKIEPHDESLVEDYFTAEEGELVGRAPAEERALYITLIWCAKESALKSLRQGLRRDTRSIAVSFPEAADKEVWNPFIARCQESSLTFHGWWRVSAGFIQAITSAAPSILREGVRS
jgi:4'-phosphopantetheinyl transferase